MENYNPLLITLNKKKCKCGRNFEDIYFQKKIECFECLKTFSKEFQKIIYDTRDLDEIYLIEKTTLSNYVFFSPKYSLNKNLISSVNYDPKLQVLKNISYISNHYENKKLSIRLRYTRNFYGFPFYLSKEKIIDFSLFLLHKNSFLVQELKKFNIYFSEENSLKKEKINYVNLIEGKIIFSDFKIGSVRIYLGEEDHFRMEVIFFLERHKRKVQIFEKKILKIYQIFLYLDTLFEWEFDPNLGFLNHSLTNTGSGIRIYIKIFIEKEITKFLNYFQKNYFFSRLKNYTIRGSQGENSMLTDSIIIGWDLPYLNLKKFYNDIKKRLILWFYQLSYTMLKKE